jgi:phosphoketolase
MACRLKAPSVRTGYALHPAPIPNTSSYWKAGAKLRPEELFDEQGRLKPELADLAPEETAWARILTPTAHSAA